MIVEFAWRIHEWWRGSGIVADLTPKNLEAMTAAEAVALGAWAGELPPQLGWDAGRATTGPLVLGVAGAVRRFPERAVSVLATAVEVVLTREIASVSARMNALLQERAHMACAIHEGVAQDLATLAFQLEVVQELITREPRHAEDLLRDAQGVVRSAIDHVRSAIFELTPVVPEDTWLADGLKRFVDEFARVWHLDLSFRFEGKPGQLLEPEALALVFAFAQEALTNLRKHSGGRRGEVVVGHEDGALFVTIRDDGSERSGGDEDVPTWPPGQGLNLMRGRARLLGGDVRFARSRAGETQVKLRVPI